MITAHGAVKDRNYDPYLDDKDFPYLPMSQMQN